MHLHQVYVLTMMSSSQSLLARVLNGAELTGAKKAPRNFSPQIVTNKAQL
jgi:hypothetical protein